MLLKKSHEIWENSLKSSNKYSNHARHGDFFNRNIQKESSKWMEMQCQESHKRSILIFPLNLCTWEVLFPLNTSICKTSHSKLIFCHITFFSGGLQHNNKLNSQSTLIASNHQKSPHFSHQFTFYYTDYIPWPENIQISHIRMLPMHP